MRYTLRQIEVFLAIARHQNVSRAAEDLALSQSAASGALKELEGQFGTQLFDRYGKRLQLNAHGYELRAHAEALLLQARELETRLVSHHSFGNLTLGATLTIGNYLCVDLMAAYLAAAPGASIKLKIANTDTIARELLDFDIDLGLLEGEYQHPELDIRPWREDELLVFCAAESPLATRHSLDDGDLLAAEWILRERGSGTRQSFDRAMHGLLPQLRVHLELEQTEAIKRAVRRGMGISCLSRLALEDEIARGELIPLATPTLNLRRQLYVAIHRHKYRSPSIDKWLELCGLTLTE